MFTSQTKTRTQIGLFCTPLPDKITHEVLWPSGVRLRICESKELADKIAKELNVFHESPPTVGNIDDAFIEIAGQE